jgi:hypothetical protein
VGMDSTGKYFVVVWSGQGTGDSSGIFARLYDNATGLPIGTEFRVNQYVPDIQAEPSVAMDPNGDFVVSWTSYGQDSDRDGIYARKFNAQGQALGNELMVNATVTGRQDKSDVAIDADGDYVVVWESYAQDGSAWGVYGRYNNSGNWGNEFQINQFTNDKQIEPKVAMDQVGNAVVVWSSFGQDGSGYGVYARRYSQTGAALSNEFQVNNNITANWQVTPDVGMDSKGNFVITWSSFGATQPSTGDPNPDYDYGIYARMYNPDGSDFLVNGQAMREHRINATIAGNQTTPAITVTPNTGFVDVWVGPDNGGTGIFMRAVGSTTTTVTPPVISNLTVMSYNAVGLYNPLLSKFYLRYTNDAGVADTSFTYGPANSGWIPLVGDWDGDGDQTVGLYNPVTSKFYLRDFNDAGTATYTFAFGPANSGWKPIVGDWDGDGVQTIGLYNPATSRFYLRNSNDAGYADETFVYGPAGGGWTPIVGNWDGDTGGLLGYGTQTIGLYNPVASKFYLRNTNDAGVADIAFAYGPSNAGWTPIVGDWNGIGAETIGLHNPVTGKYYLRNTNDAGTANNTFSYGPSNSIWTPLAGNWLGNGNPLMAAETQSPASPGAAALTQADLQPIVTAAIARWIDAGLSATAADKLSHVQIAIGNLPGAYLSKTAGNTIVIDTDAAGNGWFVDDTPAADDEFTPVAGHQNAVDSRAVDRIDLLTVVEHELGHVLGLDDLDALADNLMSGTLGAGARRVVSYQNAVDAAVVS